jgi:hypothetical protein
MVTFPSSHEKDQTMIFIQPSTQHASADMHLDDVPASHRDALALNYQLGLIEVDHARRTYRVSRWGQLVYAWGIA